LIGMYWEEDVFYGGNLTAPKGSSAFIIKPGGNISLETSEKYLGSFTVYLDWPETADKLEKCSITNGTHEKVIAQNIPLSSVINLQFAKPRPIPTDWWISASFHLNSTKRIVVYTEILDNPQEEI